MNKNLNLKAVDDKIVILKLENCKERMYGDIIVPLFVEENMKMTKGKILSIGPNANIYNLNVGDVVMYDTFSVFDNSDEVVITKAENVIIRVVEE